MRDLGSGWRVLRPPQRGASAPLGIAAAVGSRRRRAPCPAWLFGTSGRAHNGFSASRRRSRSRRRGESWKLAHLLRRSATKTSRRRRPKISKGGVKPKAFRGAVPHRRRRATVPRGQEPDEPRLIMRDVANGMRQHAGRRAARARNRAGNLPTFRHDLRARRRPRPWSWPLVADYLDVACPLPTAYRARTAEQ